MFPVFAIISIRVERCYLRLSQTNKRELFRRSWHLRSAQIKASEYLPFDVGGLLHFFVHLLQMAPGRVFRVSDMSGEKVKLTKDLTATNCFKRKHLGVSTCLMISPCMY